VHHENEVTVVIHAWLKCIHHLLAHGQWFSPGTTASSTTKTGSHDIAESGIKHNKSNHIKSFNFEVRLFF
jgi:hypothetical protein